MLYDTFIRVYFGGIIHMNTGIPDDSADAPSLPAVPDPDIFPKALNSTDNHS